MNYPRLAPGTLIEMNKRVAVVKVDDGGEHLTVMDEQWVEGVWPWRQGLKQCKVLRTPTPDVSAALSDKSSSRWLVNTILTALLRDPVDAVNDADIVSELLGVESANVLREFREKHSKRI